MTPLLLWVALAGVALTLTLFWAIFARETQVYLTAGTSFGLWGWLAISGGDLALVTTAGDPVYVSQPALQYLALALALVSMLVFMLYHFRAYPPSAETGDIGAN